MRRLLVLPLLASVFAFAPSASAEEEEVPCHGVFSGNAVVGVCAGVICNDLCGPRVVVAGECEGVEGQLAALCAAWDGVSIG